MAADLYADYVIIGAGSAGCVLANRLTENGKHRVVLLEAGGDDRPLHEPRQFMSNMMIHTPIGFGKTLNDPKVNWLYETEVDEGSGNRSHKWPKGKVLGGSSSINGLLYVRGQSADYDGWAQMGARGWSWDDVLPYFRKSQNQERGENEFHGAGGPLNVSDFPEHHPVSAALVEACTQAGIPYKEDLNDGNQEGVSFFQMTAKNGRRQSTAVAYLHPAMGRENLLVETHAMTTRILFEGKKAVGVEYRQGSETRRVMVRREVIVSAGAVESPKLLEISGVGQGALLQELGVHVVHESPMVGENLQDHFMIGCQAPLKEDAHSINHLSRGVKLLGQIAKYGVTRKGLLSYAVAHGCAFVKSRDTLDFPDIQIHVMAASMDLEYLNQFQGLRLDKEPGLASNPCQLRPESRGSIHAHSRDGMVTPKIVPNYLSDPIDRQSVVDQLKIIRNIWEQPALKPYLKAPGDPFGSTDEEMIGYAKLAGGTLYHAVGTVAMGDERFPLDPEMRVRGVEGLRVIDASVFPKIPSGNTNAPTIMVAEKGSDMILQAAKEAIAA
ncbi:choline dehydrogenase [Altererythrobacter atlanticus]|uniref:Alcohol dehydrogenase n=1 Tax=Croceibacterium atlanticum TaxID=1267766 RepID=A0A0F7KYC0_9SPHN|nr:GMC family oxidoreductase N-terminal domain-containing protein [Croceibacterium atlanticum]AKH43815.1 Alcohol dehydrogenase [Croceibacterium atlanticum]MBB5733735.1 choline dehydrogenase [Croceibacterium atlanticum]